jgi:hypothetical protein
MVTPSPSLQQQTPVAGRTQIPSCLGTDPNIRPDWWTDACGDAGFQLTSMHWTGWSRESASARGIAAVTHGELAGQRWSMHVVFDRPVWVAHLNHWYFSRATITYLEGPGPDGRTRDVHNLRGLWDFAEKYL